MNDTHPEIEKRMHAFYKSKTPLERLHMGFSMYQFAKGMAKDSILNKTPHMSEKELKKELFLRFYDNDFDETQKQKIIDYLITSP